MRFIQYERNESDGSTTDAYIKLSEIREVFAYRDVDGFITSIRLCGFEINHSIDDRAEAQRVMAILQSSGNLLDEGVV